MNATAVDDSELHLSRITEMTILTIKLIVEFSKRLTFFDRLLKDDQITLLKVEPGQGQVTVGSRSGQGRVTVGTRSGNDRVKIGSGSCGVKSQSHACSSHCRYKHLLA